MNPTASDTNEHHTSPAPGWDYSPAPERTPVELDESYGLFIDGAFRAPKSRKRFDSINPATEQTLASVAEAGAKDVDDAFEGAEYGAISVTRLIIERDGMDLNLARRQRGAEACLGPPERELAQEQP